jgi:hypothetical protein
VFKHHVVGHHVKTLQKCFSPAREGEGFFCFNFVKEVDWRGDHPPQASVMSQICLEVGQQSRICC